MIHPACTFYCTGGSLRDGGMIATTRYAMLFVCCYDIYDGCFFADHISAASTMPAACITVCESVTPWHSTLLSASSLSIINYYKE
jgi:hypothetical protein